MKSIKLFLLEILVKIILKEKLKYKNRLGQRIQAYNKNIFNYKRKKRKNTKNKKKNFLHIQ